MACGKRTDRTLHGGGFLREDLPFAVHVIPRNGNSPMETAMPLDTAPQNSTASSAFDRDTRLEFLGLDAASGDRLRHLLPVVTAALPGITERFYAVIGQRPELAPLLGGPDNIARLKRTQIEHWQHLFHGTFDDAYFRRADQIGHAHERIGLEPRWYTGGYALVLTELLSALAAKSRGKDLAADMGAVLRAAFLDMDLAISTYIRVGEANRTRRDMLAMSETLEREMEVTAAEITAKAERLATMAEELQQVAEQVRTMAESVSASVETTAQNVQGVAGATQELEASSREITGHVGRATGMTREAVEQVSATGTTVQALSGASGRIADVVGLVRSIAGQTKLLALNATIEAARAGEMGKGFAVVASEVKSLARQTEDAIGNVSSQAQSIAGATRDAAVMVERIAEHVRAVDAVSAEISAATDQQRDATAEIMRNVTLAAEHVASVADNARRLHSQAEVTDGSAGQFRTLAKSVSTEIRDLNRRLMMILRASHAGNRRQADRESVAIGFSFTAGGITASGFTADLSQNGALLVAEVPESLTGQKVTLRLDGIGTIEAIVRGVSPMGIHIQFGRVDAAAEAAIVRVLAEARQADQRYITLCQSVAAETAHAFEAALDAGRIKPDALFSNHYDPVAGSDPPQHLSPSVSLCEAVLPALMERAKRSDPRIIFCVPTDRNGYAPVHHPDASHPQRPDDPVWNALHSRNRRIYDDRAAILAARNPNPILVQTYQRDLGSGKTVLKEFDSPIMVRGQQWGAVRMAIKP